MMGERDSQKQLWSYQVNLDKRVRSDHPLRRINQALDLDFVRPEVARFYGAKGNVSEDPVVIVKMMLLLFLDNVRSERELMRIIPNGSIICGFWVYGLDDTIVLSEARKRWGQEVFVTVFSRVVAQCGRAGLVEGTKNHADSSLVAANASLNSVRELDAVTLDQIQRATQIGAETIVADCKYGTIENYIDCQKRKLRTHMADLLASSPGSGHHDGIYPESMFRYQPQNDTFLCPDGQVMKAPLSAS